MAYGGHATGLPLPALKTHVQGSGFFTGQSQLCGSVLSCAAWKRHVRKASKRVEVFEYFGTASRAMFTMFELTLASLGCDAFGRLAYVHAKAGRNDGQRPCTAFMMPGFDT